MPNNQSPLPWKILGETMQLGHQGERRTVRVIYSHQRRAWRITYCAKGEAIPQEYEPHLRHAIARAEAWWGDQA